MLEQTMSRRLASGILTALTAAALLTGGVAGEAQAAKSPTISVKQKVAKFGQTVEFTAKNLDPKVGYYVMLCQNQPDFFPVCSRPTEVKNSYVHLSNASTDALPIPTTGPHRGTVTGKLRLARHDLSLFGPVPNNWEINCAAFGGCSVSIVEDHKSAKILGGMVPQSLAGAPIQVS